MNFSDHDRGNLCDDHLRYAKGLLEDALRHGFAPAKRNPEERRRESPEERLRRSRPSGLSDCA